MRVEEGQSDNVIRCQLHSTKIFLLQSHQLICEERGEGVQQQQATEPKY